MKKSGFADWNTTTFTDGSASMSVISALNSAIVEGTNMLIGGLLKVIVHRAGNVRSTLNCATLASLGASLAWIPYVGFAMFFPPFAQRRRLRLPDGVALADVVRNYGFPMGRGFDRGSLSMRRVAVSQALVLD